MTILTPNFAFAAESNNESINRKVEGVDAESINSEIEDLNAYFLRTYNYAKDLVINSIQSDEEAYAALLQNREFVLLAGNNTLKVNFDKIANRENLSASDCIFLKNFVDRINSLVNNQAISINENLLFRFVTNVKPTFVMRPMANSIAIMGTTRNHAKTLKSVYNNAAFHTKHLTAGQKGIDKYNAEH
ncbi:hypothetical protein B4064_3566 [Caldibacillus thermoamylovorans]|nr:MULTISPECIES: hypothetical protein [Bacillaceae]KIO60381.1 hypothetical protein B4064_3566 [Caldibacillus thermoamylovorans]MBU5342376.1 hypothetical protein [Caldifermentibacillus hisashii]MCB7069538.1 hypothetical protein [Caldibacillus sp. 210928-DFI.2.22]MCB7072956.1 hypothetical protein [Caldibacillus sp. 210928-DFI.2.18]